MKHFVLDHRKDDTVSTYNLDSFRLKHNCFVQNITSGSFALCYVCWLFFFFPFVSVLFPLQTNLLWHKVRNCFDHKKTLHNDSVFPASAQVQTHTSSSFSQSWRHTTSFTSLSAKETVLNLIPPYATSFGFSQFQGLI